MVFEATVVVDFGDGTDGFYVVALDDSRNIDSSGDTISSFSPGDEVYFYVHMEASYQISKITKTAGSVTNEGTYSFLQTDRVQFTKMDESVELSHIPTYISAKDFYGNDPTLTQSGRSLTNTSDYPAIGDIDYAYEAILFKFTPPTIVFTEDDEEFPVLIVIYMEEI